MPLIEVEREERSWFLINSIKLTLEKELTKAINLELNPDEQLLQEHAVFLYFSSSYQMLQSLKIASPIGRPDKPHKMFMVYVGVFNTLNVSELKRNEDGSKYQLHLTTVINDYRLTSLVQFLTLTKTTTTNGNKLDFLADLFLKVEHDLKLSVQEIINTVRKQHDKLNEPFDYIEVETIQTQDGLQTILSVSNNPDVKILVNKTLKYVNDEIVEHVFIITSLDKNPLKIYNQSIVMLADNLGTHPKFILPLFTLI